MNTKVPKYKDCFLVGYVRLMLLDTVLMIVLKLRKES